MCGKAFFVHMVSVSIEVEILERRFTSAKTASHLGALTKESWDAATLAEVLNPIEGARSYSSVFADDAVGNGMHGRCSTRHRRGRLGQTPSGRI